jgi:hypothetical protein
MERKLLKIRENRRKEGQFPTFPEMPKPEEPNRAGLARLAKSSPEPRAFGSFEASKTIFWKEILETGTESQKQDKGNWKISTSRF